MQNYVGIFEKVSLKQFIADFTDIHSGYTYAEIESIYHSISLPKRSTIGSAGYDFKYPIGFTLAPGETIKIATGIRAKIDNGWWLGCLPRSGHGFKYRLQLNNTMGVVDSDYYGSDNEGHLFARMTNDSNEGKVLTVKPNEAFMQGIFLPYGITYDDTATGIRNGGFGSTSATKTVETQAIQLVS